MALACSIEQAMTEARVISKLRVFQYRFGAAKAITKPCSAKTAKDLTLLQGNGTTLAKSVYSQAIEKIMNSLVW